jgi:FKBP-type peptidyl-prolyl cis-trans isomerase FkpA
MTEITRVPIKPVGTGALAKLWIGVVLAIALGGGLAWAALPKTLSVETLVEGKGESPKVGDLAFVKYTGTLADTGEEFDKWKPEQLPIKGIFPEGSAFPVQEGATIPGFFEGLQKMQKGGKYKLYIPSHKAYGDEPPPGSAIPAGADLIFEIELVDFFTQEEVERKIAIIQRAMQAQGGPGGPQGGAPLGGAPQGAPQGVPGQ